MWAKHESPRIPPETLETDRHIVNALKVKAVGSKSKYKERHLISSQARVLPPLVPVRALNK